MSNKLRLKHITLTATHRCPLKCKLCASYSPHFVNTPHFSTDLLKCSVDEFFAVVNFVDKFVISGGEPLLHEGINEVVAKTMEYTDNFGSMEIITSGTVTPNEKLLAVLSVNKEKVNLMVDDYGPLSRNIDKVEKALKEYGIPYRRRCYFGENAHLGGWVDYGDFSFKWEQKDLKDRYRDCAHSKENIMWEIRNGQMHMCVRTHTMMELGLLERDGSWYLDLFDDRLSADEKREKIRKLMQSEWLPSCAYCNGLRADSQRFTPAEQMS